MPNFWQMTSRLVNNEMPIFWQSRGVPRRYALIRTDENWLLHLTKDQP